MPSTLRNALMTLALLLLGAGIVHAQDQSVSGTVTDAQTGEPLPGVNVTAPGTTIGTTTDGTGTYSLTVPQDVDSLAFSFVGYQRTVRAQEQVKSLDPNQAAFSESSQTDSLIIDYTVPSNLPDSTTFIDLDVEVVNENGLKETNETALNFAISGFGVTGKK